MSRFALLLLIWVSINLTGCAAGVVAGAASGGYLAADDEAAESVGLFFLEAEKSMRPWNLGLPRYDPP